MYIGSFNNQSANHATNQSINAINNSARTKIKVMYGEDKMQENTDTLTLSPAGKHQSMIQQLMKQKEFLQDRKQSVLASASENGSGSMDQVKEYEKQMEAIDQQIAELQSEQASGSAADSNDSAGQIYEKPVTREEAEASQLNTLTQLASTADRAQVLSDVKDNLNGRIRVLNAEIKTGNGNIEVKIEAVSSLEEKVGDIDSQIAEHLGASNDTVDTVRSTLSEADISEDKESDGGSIEFDPEEEPK
jgi:predicted  nucleic acid-binding Zn-ribbon protein